MRSMIEVGGKKVGDGEKCFIIAEVSQNHDGSLGQAHAFIDAVADAGADAIKFQTHIAACESSLEDEFRVPFSYEDATRFDYWKRMEFSLEAWQGLFDHCVERNLIFLSSPFSFKAFELLNQMGCPAWKVGSGEIFNKELLNQMVSTNKPLLLSTGMISYEELDQILADSKILQNNFALFQCYTAYPCPFEKVGLNVIDEMRAKYSVPVGLSDHSASIFPSLFAMAQKANLIEVHVAFDRRMFGPDVKASLTIDELKVLCDGAKALQLMEGNPLDKKEASCELSRLREIFSKSIGVSREMKKGEVLQEEDLVLLKPGKGIPWEDRNKLLTRKLGKDLKRNSLIHWDDFIDDE